VDLFCFIVMNLCLDGCYIVMENCYIVMKNCDGKFCCYAYTLGCLF
jgi:hypothetical protein